MLKYELSDVACIDWFIGWKGWIGNELGMDYEWRIGYKCWHEIFMYDNHILGWWNMILMWLGRNSTIVSWWYLIG